MSDLRLILVNFVVAGLEIASSVAFTFIPPLLLKSGYSETQMSIIFGVGKLPSLFDTIIIVYDLIKDTFTLLVSSIQGVPKRSERFYEAELSSLGDLK